MSDSFIKSSGNIQKKVLMQSFYLYFSFRKFYNLTERLYQDYFYTVVAPLVWGQKMTFFMPSQQFMEKIPDRKLNALSGLNLAKVRFNPDQRASLPAFRFRIGTSFLYTLRERLRIHKFFTKRQYYRSVFTLITISSP